MPTFGMLNIIITLKIKRMKRKLFNLLVLVTITISSCQSPETDTMKVIDNFYNEINEHGADKYQGSLKKSREALNYAYVSTEMEGLIRNNFVTIPKKETYKLTSVKKTDNTFMVTATGNTSYVTGEVRKTAYYYTVSKINGEWKISDANNLINLNLNFQVEDTQWNQYWDIKKANILHEIMDNLKLEIIDKGYKIYGDMMKGKLRLVNNSNYDLKGIEVLIEHYDKDGISVNTDKAYVYDVIRSKGYRELEWITLDCAKCETQQVKIKFVKETIK